LSTLVSPPPTPALLPYTTLYRSIGNDHGPKAASASGGGSLPRNLQSCSTRRCEAVRHVDLLPARSGRAVALAPDRRGRDMGVSLDRKSTRLNSSHVKNSYAVLCL